MTSVAIPHPGGRAAVGPGQTFLAICRRDVFVMVRELPAFVLQTVVQPLFLAFIFGRVLTALGLAAPNFGTVLLPGLVAMTLALTALQGIALPLVLEFGYTKEIEDRLLAPLPILLVAVEKLVIAALRGIFGGLVVLPLAWLVIGWGRVHVSGDHLAAFAGFAALAALVGSSLGLALGTLVDPRRINVMFAFIFTPLLLTSCVQYPWPGLDSIHWFKIFTLFNPLTYGSEGVRGTLAPQVPHLAAWIAALALVGWNILFVAVGLRGFLRRVVD
jgi:ABC-2 type transport system permease protein